jgi:hypothetical protein
MWIPADFLNHGLYVVGVALTSIDSMRVHFYPQDALRFHVTEKKPEDFKLGVPGAVRPMLDWNVVQAG